MRQPIIDVDPLPRDMLDAKLRGPRDEKRHANALAVKHVSETARDLVQSGRLQGLETLGSRSNPLFEKVKRNLRQRETLAKAGRPDRVHHVAFDALYEEGMAMASVDPSRYGTHPPIYLERPVGLSFNQLREVVRQDVQLDLIISTRIAQVLRYLKRAKFEWQPGHRFTFLDEARETGDEDAERFRLLHDFLNSCGMETNPRKRRALKRDDLRTFTIKHLRDSLTMDAAPIELVPTVGGRTHGWIAVDAATIYLTDPTWGLMGSGHEQTPSLNQLAERLHVADPSEVIAVRNVDGAITAHYSDLDMLYPLRNVSTDERRYGYGDAEPEIVLKMVTGFLNAMTFNNRALDDNSVPPGVLVLHGDFEEDDIDFLKQDWLTEVSGAGNRHRLPVMVTRDKDEGGVSFVNTGQQISDVSYAKWISLLTAIKCSRYLMDPTEISFEAYYSGASAGLNAGSDTEERITSSRDKGLHAILDWYGGTLNEIVQEVDPEVRLDWSGLDVSKEEALAREEKLSTWGELRSKYGISSSDVADELLDAPLNPVVSGVYSQVMQAEQQEAMGQQGADGMAPTGEQQDVDGDGNPEEGMDADGDGQADAWQDTTPDGDRRMMDHEGNAWSAASQGQADDEDPDYPMAKAVQVNLFDPYRES